MMPFVSSVATNKLKAPLAFGFGIVVVVVSLALQGLWLWDHDGTSITRSSKSTMMRRPQSTTVDKKRPESGTVDKKRPATNNKAVQSEEEIHHAVQQQENDLFQDSNEEEDAASNGESLLLRGSSADASFTTMIPRVFEPWSRPSLPCFPAEEGWDTVQVHNRPTDKGFLFLKPYKTGSSTTSGVNLRIARNVAKRLNKDFDMCLSRYDHGPHWYPAASLFPNRDTNASFLWTVLREPTKRLTSEFFHFSVSRRGVEPTDDNFQSFLLAPQQRDYYLRSLLTSDKYTAYEHDPVQTGNRILSEYDFIGVMERFDETAVALMMLLNLPMADILYVTAKKHGGYDAGGGGGKCTFIQPSFLSEGMQEFLKTDSWKDRIKYDLALYQAANRSLDLTIDRLGRDRFEKNLVLFRKAQERIETKCVPNAVFPCMEGGVFHPPEETDCLWKDSGCGTTCLDEVATELNLWNTATDEEQQDDDTEKKFRGIVPRAFDPWPSDDELPCFAAEDGWDTMKVHNRHTTKGFLYLKPYKTGSSTTSGINLRIARNVARRQQRGFDMCKTRYDHGPYGYPAVKLFHDRSLSFSFLWTVIREPTKRLTSAFFHFQVSRLQVEPTDENFQNYVLSEERDYYFRSLPTFVEYNSSHHDPIEVGNQILEEYNFIGVTERMDETYVVLMMLLGLPMADILYVSAKKHGGFDDAGAIGTCTYIQPSFLSEGMQKFFANPSWKKRIENEVALYQAANRSLDMTIDRLGRDKVDEQLARFRQAKELIETKCLPTVVFPCMEGGKRPLPRKETDCLWRDSGCGTTCLDEVATELKLW